MKHFPEDKIDKQLEIFDSMADKVGGVSPSKQSKINMLIFGGVVLAFTVGLFGVMSGGDEWISKLAIEVAVLLISIKLGFFLHNSVKFNHYSFWMFAAFENRLLDILKELRTQRKLLTELQKKIDENNERTD